jgi:PAS domain S-box-containing protein
MISKSEDYKIALNKGGSIAIIDQNGIITEVNDNFCGILKYTREELVGHKYPITQSDYYSEEFLYNVRQIIRSGKTWKGELHNKTKEGEDFWSDTTIVPFLDDKGKAYQYVVIHTDITAHKKLQEQLQMEERRMRLMITNTPAPIAMFDKEMRYIAASDRWISDYGLEDKNIIGQSHYDIFPNLSAMWKEFHRRCFQGESFESEEDYFMRATGKYEWLRWKLCPWYISDGNIGGLLLFSEVITKRKEAKDMLYKMNEELEKRVEERTLELTQSLEREKEMNELKSRFVTTASHEFRTPLAAILSSTVLLGKYSGPEDTDKREKHIGRIKQSVANLTDILEDFLSVERLSQQMVDVNFAPFDLKELKESMKGTVEGMLKKGQTLTCKHKGETEVVLDKKIVKNILLNLFSNAIKYSGDGQEIAVATEVSKDKIAIQVKDAGIGIPEEEQKNLFKTFFRARNVENIQGTGLGLVIVKRYVQLLGGTVTFKSILNQGTTFLVEFPRKM